jgi:hypothetical protein
MESKLTIIFAILLALQIGVYIGIFFYKRKKERYRYKGVEIENKGIKGNLVLIYDDNDNLIMTYRVINGVIQKETINTLD